MSQVNQLLAAEWDNEQAIIAEEIRMEDLQRQWDMEVAFECGDYDDELSGLELINSRFQHDLFQEEDAGFLATDDRWLEMYAFEHQEMRELSFCD